MKQRRFCRIAASLLLLLPGLGQAESVCTIMKEVNSGQTLLEEGDCTRQFSPAATFNIALSLMGYDAGYLTDHKLPQLPYHDFYRALEPEQQPVSPKIWMQHSVEWYSQQLTEWLGEQRFSHYVNSFNYGNRQLGGDPGQNNGLTRAWLSSSLQISPTEQLEFLRKVLRRQLFITKHAYDMTYRITELDTLAGWTLYGKTGSGVFKQGDAEQQFGWFVGWANRGNRYITFAQTITEEQGSEHSIESKSKEILLNRLTSVLNER